MRFFILTLILCVPAHAQSSDALFALSGLETVARQSCNYTDGAVDEFALAAGLDGPIGDAMGLRNDDSIIGIIYADDPIAGARMWASTLVGRPNGCEILIQMLSRPAADVIAELE